MKGLGFFGVRNYIINDHCALYANLFWCKSLLEMIALGFMPSNALGLGHSDFASIFNYWDGPRGRHALNNMNGFLQRKSGEACG
jgi:hypothetical protein